MKKWTLIFGLLTPVLAISQPKIPRYEIFEIKMKAAVQGNPFLDVDLQALFFQNNGKDTIRIRGFYDGDNTFVLRFMPLKEGVWQYHTSSNIKTLNGRKGSLVCIPPLPNRHGPVYVCDTFHFCHADGTPFYPVGTTCYQWVFQGNPEQTLKTLATSPFNKIRMCVFPKVYGEYISNEPSLYPFEGSREKGFDFSRPNPAYFRFFERYIDSLKRLGIEADVIVFHPYDNGRWGISQMPAQNRIHYLKYLVARLSSFPNVWWSLANEFEFLGFTRDEWEEIFLTLVREDPYHHLRSIHNAILWYDVSKPYITHLSVQGTDFFHIQQWRFAYHKPVIIDEFVYEGNLPNDWGNLPPEEVVHRCWTIYTRGGYFTHGETYDNPEKVLWWSKGGKLYGQSPRRIAFLKTLMEEAPRGIIPHYSGFNKETYLKKEGEYYLFYYGITQQKEAILDLPENVSFVIEVIDAWNMTREQLPGTYSGTASVPLPGRSYMAVRAKKKE